MLSKVVSVFMARLENSIMNINNDLLLPTMPRESAAITKAILEAKQNFPPLITSLLAKVMSILFKIDWEHIYLIPEEVVQLYLHIRKAIFDIEPSLRN